MRRSPVLRLLLCAVLVLPLVVGVPATQAGAYYNPWHWLNPLPTGDTINAVAMSPSGSSCLWVVGNYGLIQKTFDYGNSWHKFDPAGMTGNPDLIDIDLIADSIGWAVGADGTIVKISDGWNVAVQTPPTEAVGMALYAVDVIDSTHAFAVGEQGLVIKTVDGSSWTTVQAPGLGGFSDYHAVVALSPTECLAAGLGNGGVGNNDVFYYSGSLFWNKSTGDVDFAAEDMAFDAVSKTLWVVGRDKVTGDPLGYSVTSTDLTLPNNNVLAYSALPSLALASGGLTGIARADATHIWLVTEWGEVLFGDGVGAWTSQTLPYQDRPMNGVGFRKTADGDFEGAVVGYSGALASTLDGGATWDPRPSQTDESVIAIDFVSKSVGFATAGNDVIKSVDSGQTWQTLTTGSSRAILDLDFIDATKGYVVGEGGTALSFNGSSWLPMGTGMGAWDFYGVNAVDTSNVWACGWPSLAAKWNGTAWTAVTDPDLASSTYWDDIDFFGTQNGALVGANYILYTSTGGLSWDVATTPAGASDYITDVEMVSSSVGFAVGMDNDDSPSPGDTAAHTLMLKTEDGGANWTEMTPPTGQSWKQLDGVSFATPTTGWIVGGMGVIWKTTDGGTTWTNQQMSTEWFSAVSATSDGEAFAGGDYGLLVSTYWPPAPPAKKVVYRFYNMKTGTHLYTADVNEKHYIIDNLSSIYKFEGVCYEYDETKAESTLVRFYRPSTNTHFYSADPVEINRVRTTLAGTYKYEGPVYNVSFGGGEPVWRFYNKKNGTHFYTADPAERDNVRNNLSATYTYEGAAYYLPQ